MRGLAVRDIQDTEYQEANVLSLQPPAGCDEWMYSGQYIVQVVLLLISLVCVPIMLIPKPFIMRRQHESRVRGRQMAINSGGGQVCISVRVHACACVHMLSLCLRNNGSTQTSLTIPSPHRLTQWHLPKRSLSLAKCSLSKQSTPLSLCWAPSPTLPRTSGCGRCPWLTGSSRRCCGTW